LNELLDERRHWTADPALVVHCAGCFTCRATAEAYYAVARAASADCGIPEASCDLAASVLAEFSRGIGTTAKAATINGTRHWTRWMVAAILLLAGTPIAMFLRSSLHSDFDSNRSVEASNAVWQFRGELAHLLGDAQPSSEYVWRTTGRGIAELPQQVRRAAALSESTQLNAAIRPVAVAWDALRRVLPGESMRSAPEQGETGFVSPHTDSIYV
jgi:hypothetical protein